jgi:imidazolonepropionase-like amidohydrolase
MSLPRVVDIVVASSFVVCLLGSACAGRPLVARLERDETIVFTDINVVDGTGAPPLTHQDVVVAGDRIFSIAPTGGAVNGRRIDGRNKTLLPGFVDAHAHVSGRGVANDVSAGFTTSDNLQRWLLAGVTTVFDMSGAGPEMGDLAERIDDAAIPGPRLFHTHLVITGKDSHPITLSRILVPGGFLAGWVLPQVENDEDIAAALDEADAQYVDYVKITVDRMPSGTPQLERPLLEKLVREAKRRGHLVFVHAGHADDAVAAAEAGATALAHLPWRGEFTPELAQRLKKTGVVVVTTVAMWETLPKAIAGTLEVSAADRKLVPPDILQSVTSPQKDPAVIAIGAELQDNATHRERSFQALLVAGVPLLVGTDSVLPAVWPGSGFVNEMQALLAHGLPVNELIIAMTSRPARLIAGDNADFGVVAAGKCADLVVVDGDPLIDPTALWRVSLVVRAGRVVEDLRRP